MNLLGVHLTMLVGPTVALPAPPVISSALESVEVFHNDEGPSGFQLIINAGVKSPLALFDYPLLAGPFLKPFNRVILIATFDLLPHVLMDGFITHLELKPGAEPGTDLLYVTGEDITVKMDMHDKNMQYPEMPVAEIVGAVLAEYEVYGLVPEIVPPPVDETPLSTDGLRVQQCTDLRFLKNLARCYGYLFYVTPGPAPESNQAYFGPPRWSGIPQPALTVNMEPATNVEHIRFSYDALKPVLVEGVVQDANTNLTLPVATVTAEVPPLVTHPAPAANMPFVRTKQLRASGLTETQAFARAAGTTNHSVAGVVTVDGDLDAMRYNGILQSRGLVGLRGAGYSFDGLYYVKSVTHKMRRGEYRQEFVLTRDGTGSLTPVVLT